MSSVKELHERSMELAQRAMISRHKGDNEQAVELAGQAAKLEAEAAELIPENMESEPTRSILYRSAASLAYQGEEFKLSQNLILKGLLGYPPIEIETELKNLYEQVNFEQNLLESGLTLEQEDFQLSLQGSMVGAGTILIKEFMRRLEAIQRLISKTTQRLMGRTFQTSGPISTEFQIFVPAISVPRAGSFSVTIKLAKFEETHQMQYLVTAEEVINQLMEGVDLVNKNDFEGLIKIIQIESYFENFIQNTKELAPDGKNINLVGFSTPKRVVTLSTPRSEIKKSIDAALMKSIKEEEVVPVEIQGEMDYADSRNVNRIGLTTENGDRENIIISEGMVEIVRLYYGNLVIISGVRKGKDIHLSDIQGVE